MSLLAPFPWFGGKSKVSPLVWDRFGDVQNYVEPFFGSGAGKVGASPDGAMHSIRRSVEIKSPEKPQNHVAYMLNEQSLVDEYFSQTQGQLYVLGADYDSTDLISYFGGMPMVCVNVPKHPEFQKRLDEALKLFTNDLALYVDLAKTKGWIKDREEPKVRDVSKDFISDADLEAILAARKG